MSDDKKTDDEQVFLNWLEGKEQQQKMQNEQWQQRVSTANSARHQVAVEHQQNVPHWDRGAAFSTEHQPWWQWRALPAMSMAFSILAVALVLFKVELVIQPEGVMLSFSGDIKAKNDAEIAKLVNVKLREFAAEQQVMLANYATDFTTKQQESNLQLASYVIGATRQERKEDMNDFISYINEQRKDENLTQKIKFNQLERKIDRTSYQNSTNKNSLNKSEDIGYQVTPANWTTEE